MNRVLEAELAIAVVLFVPALAVAAFRSMRKPKWDQEEQ